ncbi:c-type cytochrome biogenesis protein CcmI [Celeribacter arenosi]|uniref:C-type cytochrome biogenesis protein CcmI n=1 Tax=Celeribacter arenosi TaxID=792649 RepID=A0ABP7KGJ4_9RHOB
MTFWIIAIFIAALSAAPLGLSLWRARGIGKQDQGQADTALRVYRDQLAEVDRDLARGVLGQADAERARTEISRRILDADRQKGKSDTAIAAFPVWGAALLMAGVIAGAVALYTSLGVPGYPDLPLTERLRVAEESRKSRALQSEAEESAPVFQNEIDPNHLDLLERLRAALETRTGDLRGHELLARNEAAVGNFVEAYQAQSKIIAIKGADATSQDYAELADLMILAAGGYVSPEAETALVRALERDPDNGTAIYYSGLMFAQNGRPDRTFTLWQGLLNSSEPNDLWVPAIRDQIESVAQAAGVRYTLPPQTGLAGPSADDVAAAADMSDDDRQSMIRGMVNTLSARLANEGGTPQEWARLVSSLGVLGDTERARAIWGEAQVVFGADPEALATVRAAAEQAGVAQ